MHWSFLSLLITLFLSLHHKVLSSIPNGLISNNLSVNNTIFTYQDINQCKRNEFYDLNYFICIACNINDENLHSIENKFACQCVENKETITIYDSNRDQPLCSTFANKCNQLEDITTTNPTPTIQSTSTSIENINSIEEISKNCNDSVVFCNLKFINKTTNDDLKQLTNTIEIKLSKSLLHISRFKLINHMPNNSNVDVCQCDLKYNFRYQDFCIVNELLKPYLHYNTFWQIMGSNFNGHIGDLKFIAFFCLQLRNATACQQLANLCVMSHFSMDKNSPCSTFLLTQSSDVIIRYAVGIDEQLQIMQPFLFFKKGKQMAEQLMEVITESNSYSLSDDKKLNTQLQIFSLSFALDGSLLRRGDFQLEHINLCGNLVQKLDLSFGKYNEPISCTLSLENLIDLATSKSQRNFLSLYLNFTKIGHPNKVYLQPIPILIENLIQENQRPQAADWLLVKRFQMITIHPRHNYGPQKPIYDDTYKLYNYRALRYVEKFVFHYKIHKNNRISIPLVRLHYQNIDIHSNSSLKKLYNFKMEIIFEKAEVNADNAQRNILNETLLPLLLLAVIAISLLRAHNHRKRRRTTILTNNNNSTTHVTTQNVPIELCDFRAITEFFLQFCSNASFALLICFLLHIIYDATKFFTQKELKIILPLIKNHNNYATTLNMLIYGGLCFKLIFYCIHLWRSCHVDLFFIDWERPKSYDNHFNLKSNLETSSVCSSVRTFTAEGNISAWRIFFTANEWIRLSRKRKTSIFVQCFGLLLGFELFNIEPLTQKDLILKLYFIILIYLGTYVFQHLYRIIFINQINGNPLQKFIDLCSWANISVFVLLEPSYGYYIHGRSPHGFAETDMSSMIMQLQRESQSMCGRRGLLTDSDQQTYIMLPPANLRTYFQRLLIPFQRSCSISQAHYQKETSISTVAGGDGNLERTFIAYSSVNRFFCAFIDHAIKDMDYIIKEMTIFERFLDCEFENYLTENKGTFYIDKANSFSKLFLYGNEFHIFIMEFLLVLSTFMLLENLIWTICIVCVFDVLIQWTYSFWMRQNVAKKTLIDKRFLL